MQARKQISKWAEAHYNLCCHYMC